MKRYLILLAVGFLPLQATAAFTSFTDETAFNLANTAPLTLEGFESFSTGDTSIVASDFTLTASPPGGSINEVWSGLGPTEGVNYFGWAFAAGSSITFAFDSPQSAFSMDIVDIATISADQSISVFANGSATPVVADLLYPARSIGGRGAVDFLALVSDAPFSTLTFTFAEQEWVGIDRVQYGINPVPVPAAVWLFGTALVGLAGFSKRKKSAYPLA